MSNIIIGIIGVILFTGLAVAGTVWLGPKFTQSTVDAEAINYLNQKSQISRAIEHYASDRGRLPVESGRQPVEILVENGYLRSAPLGGESGWVLNSDVSSIITPVAGDSARANNVCIAARLKANMPDPERVLKCDGSDAPDGRLSSRDPCCLM